MNYKLVAITGAFMLSLGACTPVQTALYNLGNDLDDFRVVFVNGIADKYLLSIEGLCSITKDKEDAQLEVTCKTGDGEYKKRISDNVTEQMDPASVGTYHDKVQFCPDVDVQVSGGDK